MKNSPLPFVFLVLVATVSGIGSPVAAADDGFVPLFDGKTTAGWQKPFDWGKAWVEGETIHLQGDKKFFLVTDRTYADFILEVEVNVPVGGNSGIQFRSHFKQNGLWGYQAEVDTSDRKWSGGIYDEGRRGWLVPLKDKPQAQAAFHGGQWNKYRVQAQGDHLQVWVNGIQTADLHDKTDAAGYIALQHHGENGKVYQFRNIRIKELGIASLFNGKDLTGWESAGGKDDSCWKVEGGLLVCTGENGSWLRSTRQYGDFNLRLEYKLQPGGNSGVYIRVPKDGNHHGPGAGIEVQVLDDASPQYATLQPNQFSGSLYAIVAASPRMARPAGQWNTLEINCRGHQYRVTHNGINVVNAKADGVPQLKERRLEGFLGLQNHRTQVWYRNLRIGPPLP